MAKSIVVAYKGVDNFKEEDKYTLLQRVLKDSQFYEILEKKFKDSKKPREDFSIVVKPNIMMAYSRNDPSTITDPKLVEFLIDEIHSAGFPNISVVESQNVFSNWFKNREVKSVANYFGYSEKNYKIIDLTEEKVKYDYGGRLGNHWVGPTWKNADFRISFAKNKTHAVCYFTLTLKNIYGCTPLQNKFKHYHKKREFDWPTIEMLKHFPCDFGIIDAIWSADGIWGLKFDDTPVHSKTIIAGENIVAVEWVGAKKMGLDPNVSKIFKLAVDEFGLPDIEWIGDQSTYENWTNLPFGVDKIFDIGEEFYSIASLMGFASSDMDPYFPIKKTSCFMQALRRVMISALQFTSRLGL